jgi:uncharacterized membrane protein
VRGLCRNQITAAGACPVERPRHPACPGAASATRRQFNVLPEDESRISMIREVLHMGKIEHSIDLDAPAGVAYGQWTRFEDFPRFSRSVREIRRLDDRRWRWRADIAGWEEVWEAEIVEHVPECQIIWRSTVGAVNSGEVTFEPLAAGASRMTVHMAYEPQGLAETLGDLLGLVQRSVVRDLECFKAFVEGGTNFRSPLRAVEELVGQ